MKIAFYYSKQQAAIHRRNNMNPSTCEVNGKKFTERVDLEDDEEVKPFGKWDDYVLVEVLENVPLTKYGTVDEEALKGQITYK